MSTSSVVAFIVGTVMLVMTLLNGLFIEELSPSLERSQLLAALTSISILLIGFLQQSFEPTKKKKVKLEGESGFYIVDGLSKKIKDELAWGSQMILTATATATLLIYFENKVVLRRGLISNSTFLPGKICMNSSIKSKSISLVNTKFYPGKEEFNPILMNLPSIIVFPLEKSGWMIVGGFSERCFTKSDEIWMEGWSKKIYQLMSSR